MSSVTHRELVNELTQLYDANPERFMRFYDAVYLKMAELPEGTELVIADHVKPQSAELFLKIATLFMLEANIRAGDEIYCFSSDDFGRIRHNRPFIKEERRRISWMDRMEEIQTLKQREDDYE